MDVVSVIAGDPGQVGVPDLRQLGLSELARAGSAIIEISVTRHCPLELVSNQTLEGGTHQPPRHRALTQTADEEIHIIHVFVNQLEPLHNGPGYEVRQLTEALHPAQSTELPEGVVSRQSMISPSLYVESHQVHPEALVLALEEMVGHLLREDVVELLPGLGGQTHQELIQLSRGVDQLGVEEGVGQWNHPGLLTLVVNLLYETERDNAMKRLLLLLKYDSDSL